MCVYIYTHTYTHKVVQIWPGLIICKLVTVCPGHIWTTLYISLMTNTFSHVVLFCAFMSVFTHQYLYYNSIFRRGMSLIAEPIEGSQAIRCSRHSCFNSVVSHVHPLRNVITFSPPFSLPSPVLAINHTTAHLPSEQELVEWNISLLKVLRLHCNDFAAATVRVGGYWAFSGSWK
jgi:hypothetical protein